MATDPEIGDLIEISRGEYEHWAVYVGDGDVIHLTSASDDADDGFCCVGSSSGSSSNVRSLTSDEAKVRRDKLEVARRGNKYCINNLLDKQRNPRPIKDILKDANSLVDKIIPYGAFTNNCEHFVTELRYGKPESLQAQKAQQVEIRVYICIVILAMIYMWLRNKYR